MSALRTTLARVLGTALVAAGLAVVVAPAPAAQAAACPRGTGVTVVVNSDVRCDPSAGGYARGHFTGVGHVFEDARRFPGFVCRINGFPAPQQDRCVDASPADAYWSLWWADGKGGAWVYSQLGVNSLTVPEGGWVAFRWNVGGGQQKPPVSPVTAASGGSGGGSSSGGSSSGGGSASSSGGATGSGSSGTRGQPSSAGSSDGQTSTAQEKQERAEKREKREKKAKQEKAEEAKEKAERVEAEASASPTPTSDDLQSQNAAADVSGSLGWVAILAVLLVLGGVGGLLAWRRRSGGMSP